MFLYSGGTLREVLQLDSPSMLFKFRSKSYMVQVKVVDQQEELYAKGNEQVATGIKTHIFNDR